jgi:hypothetical protein
MESPMEPEPQDDMDLLWQRIILTLGSVGSLMVLAAGGALLLS